MNPMREIAIEKVTLNIGIGSPGEKLDDAMLLLENLTGCKSIKTVSTKRIPTWGIRKGLPIACKVTLRGNKANEFLGKLLQAVDNNLQESKFDKYGNFSFGIKEYIDIPGAKYDVNVGIIGLEVAVTLKRCGFRIKNRVVGRTKIPLRHKITKEEGIEFVKNKFNVGVGDEE